MLVLTRSLHTGDPNKATISIGQDVEVTLMEVRGDQVRLGVKAPRDVAVHRAEIYQQIQKEIAEMKSGA